MSVKSGDYVVEKWVGNHPKLQNWLAIWISTDGHDCADYLKTCVLNEKNEDEEYRMRYIK